MTGKQLAALLVLLIVVAAGTTWWLGRADQKPADNGAVAEPSAAASVSVASGSSSESPRIRDHSGNDTQHIADDGTAPVPQRYQIAGVTRVQTAASFEDWMNQFSLSQQETLRDFDKAFFGVYHDRSPEAIAWMAAHGYPMPEDVLAAEAMSNDQLRLLMENGNVKAAFFLHIRARDAMQENTGLSPAEAGRSDAAQLYGSTLEVLNQVNSPFEGYLEAWGRGRNAPEGQEADVIIPLLYWADFLGDHGALQRVQAYIDASPSAAERRYRSGLAGAVHGFSNLVRDAISRCRDSPDCSEPFPSMQWVNATRQAPGSASP